MIKYLMAFALGGMVGYLTACFCFLRQLEEEQEKSYGAYETKRHE